MEQTKRPWLSFIKTGQQAWHYLLAEPSTWLFYCFFQPARFKREFEVQSLWKRIVPMLRLALPIFLISYAFALVVQALASRPHVNIFNPLLTAAGAAVLAVGLVTVVGIFLGIFLGISAGIIGLGIAFGEITGSGMSGVIESSVTALVLGALWGTNIGASWGMMRRVLVGGLVGIAWGLIWGLIKSNPNVVIVAAIAFAVGYILGYYRPLLYLVSGSSSFRAFIASRKNPLQVFFTCTTPHSTGMSASSWSCLD